MRSYVDCWHTHQWLVAQQVMARKSIATHELDPLLGSREMSPLKVVALSRQPCKHSTDHPEALATTCAWGMENFISKNLYPQVTSSEGYMLELVPWSLLRGKSSGQSL